MMTKEQALENAKVHRMLEIETYFNNLVNAGIDVSYGGSTIRIAGGFEIMARLQAFHSYYTAKGITTGCIIRDSITKINYTDTLTNFGAVLVAIRDFGFAAFLRNAKKQDYIKVSCTTLEQVYDVTWDSTEVD